MIKKAFYKALFCAVAVMCGVIWFSADAKACETGEPFIYQSPYDLDSCPQDIQSYLDRVNGCGHFMGEEAYDQDRQDFIDEMMAEMHCADLGCDYSALFMEYEGDIVYTRILSDYTALVFGDPDNLPECAD